MGHTKNVNTSIVVENSTDGYIKYNLSEDFNFNFESACLYVYFTRIPSYSTNGLYIYYYTQPFNPSDIYANAVKLVGEQYISTGDKNFSVPNNVVNYIKDYGFLIKYNPNTTAFSTDVDLKITYPYAELKILNLSSTTNIDQGITVSWSNNSANQTSFIVEILKGNTIIANKTGTTDTSCYFSYSELPSQGQYSIRVTLSDSLYNQKSTSSISVNFTMQELFLNDLSVLGDIDNGLTFTWKQPGIIDSWTIQAYLSNVLKGTYTGSSAGYSLPACFSESGSYKFILTLTKKGQTIQDDISISLSKVTPSITNVALPSADVERGTNITVTVTGTNVDRYKVNILNTGNTVIKSDVGTTFNTAELEAGTYKAQIVAYHTNGYYTTTDTETINFKITQITPVISSATLASTNVEKGTSITTTATGTNVTGHKVNILDLNSNLVASDVGITFSTSILSAGNYKAQIIAYYTKEGAYTSYSVATLIDFTVFTYNAEITSIWPNTTRELRKSNIQIGFSAKNFTNYVISAIQNGVTKYTNSGTSASNIDEVISKSYTMINSLFDEGTVTLTVSISNVRSNYTTTDTMTVTFTVIDNPNTPIINYEQTYRTAKPMLYCNCTSIYVSYQIAIDDVVTSEIFGVISKYYFDTALENNVYHTFKVRVKNTYGLWSEWASATFYVSYAELEIPNFNVYADIINGCICVAMESQSQENFVSHSVLRLENGIWVEIGKDLERICTFYDDSCASSTVYSYKVRANDIYGGYKDSDSVEMAVDFSGTILSVPWTTEKLKLEYYANSDDITKSVSPNNKDTYVEVCGLSLPKLKRGTLKYKTLQLNIVFKSKEKYEEFINFIKNDVLLFRDGKGLKMYCHIVVSSEQDYIYYYKSVTVDITEVYYKEGDYIEVVDKPFMWAVEEY